MDPPKKRRPSAMVLDVTPIREVLPVVVAAIDEERRSEREAVAVWLRYQADLYDQMAVVRRYQCDVKTAERLGEHRQETR